MRLPSTLALVLLAAGIAVSPSSAGTSPTGSTLVELRPSARCTDATLVTAAGGSLVAPSLGLYLVPNGAVDQLLPVLRARGSLRLSTPNRIAGSLAVTEFTDPLVPTEWWRSVIGVDTLTPPPAGRAVTIIDSGIDITHPEFLGRANTETLNAQEPAGVGGEHGTGVGSVVAAPENGLGIVGVYPEALLRSWDAAKGQGTRLETAEIVQGILAAANSGPGVINLSLGADNKEVVIEQAAYEAVRKGTLIVAASGNSGDTGYPLGYPASIPHVLTVGATDTANEIADFSSRSRYVDLAAPGVAIPIATAIGRGWRTADGTSFAAPLVSGAAAWVWTVRPELDATQLFEVMRRSAVDIGAPGRDDAAGFGLLNVPAALGFPAPVRDPLEPNDDIAFVKAGGLYYNSLPPLTTPSRQTTTLRARLDVVEDPRDVYRVWLPKNGRFTATLTADTDADLALWKQSTTSVTQRTAGSDRLARSTTPGTAERLTTTNKGSGRYAFLAVVLPKGTREATYRLRIS
jgi:hypothetical protein